MKANVKNLFNPSGLSFFVLLGGPVLFGFIGQSAAASICVISGALGLAFSNIDKISRFKGAGFEAEMRDQQLEAIIARDAEPEPIEEGCGSTSLVGDSFFLSEGEMKILVSLDSQKYTWRSLDSVASECNMLRSSLLRNLRMLGSRGLVVQAGVANRVKWGLSEMGREVVRQANNV